MFTKKESALMRKTARDPFFVLRQMTSDFDRIFDDSAWPSFRWPLFRARPVLEEMTWYPEIDVFEKDNRLFAKIDLPGMKKEDVTVEVIDGQLAISGERKSELEEKKDNYYKCEREYGNFYRAVPLPEGVKLEDVKATFVDGVLEISLPLPPKLEAKPRKIEIEETPKKAAKSAA